VKLEKNGTQRLYTGDSLKFGSCKCGPLSDIDPIEYKFIADLPADSGRDDRSDVTHPADKKIKLADDFHPGSAFATMDHLADSLDSRRDEVPAYKEASPMHLRLDKLRP